MKPINFKLRLSAFAAIILISNPCFFAYSQTNVETATKETDFPISKTAKEDLITAPKKLPEPKEEKEEKIEGPEFFVTKINLIGCETFPADDFKPLVERYENKKLATGKLNTLAKEIEKEYLNRGIVAICFVPRQEIKEGIVTLQIVEAHMGELEIGDHKYFNKNRLAYYWKIGQGEILSYTKMSRSLQLMNKNPDREVKTSLRGGKKPQTTDVVLAVNTKFPAHLNYAFDREGSIFTGVKRHNIGLRSNNFLGLDDSVSGGYSFGDDFNGVYGYHIIPVSSFGTSLLYGYSYSRANPKKEYEPYGIYSRARNSTLSIYQDIFRKDTYIGNFYFGIEAKDKATKINDITTNKDKLRVIQIGGDFIHKGSNNTTSIKPELSQGINLFGARRKNPLSSRGAKNTFSKLNLKIRHSVILPLQLQLNFNLNGQVSSTELTPQEKYPLGGIDSVRGFPSGDYMADNALETNAELLIPAFFIPQSVPVPFTKTNLREDICLLTFFDYGYGRLKGALETEQKTTNIKSVGTGLRIKLPDNMALRLEWGFPLGHKPITEKGDSHFHISLDCKI